MKIYRFNNFLFSAAILAIASNAHAQPMPNVERQGLDNRQQVTQAPEIRNTDTFNLPPISSLRREANPNSISGASFVLNNIKLVGAPLLSQSESSQLITPYLNREINISDIAELRDKISLAIIQKGYLNSGAQILAQDVSDKELEINIISGRLTQTNITGLKYLSEDYINRRLGISFDNVFNVNDLRQKYQLTLEDANIEKLNVKINPGNEVGSANLEIEVTEKPRQKISIFTSSDRSPSVGAIRAGLNYSFNSLFSVGDHVNFEIGRTEALTDASLFYSKAFSQIPFGFDVFVSGSDAKIIEEPLNNLDAASNSLNYGLGISYFIMSRPGRSLTLRGSLEHSNIETSLLNLPFSFSLGAVNGVTEYSTARLSLGYTSFTTRQAFAGQITISHGINGQDLPAGIGVPNVDFTSANLNLDYVRILTNSGQKLRMKGHAQLSEDNLYSSESISIGGVNSVRGYRQNLLLGDCGYFASIEYQIPFGDITKLFIDDSFSGLGHAYLTLFADAGQVSTNNSTNSNIDELQSIGLKISWQPIPKLTIEGYYAHALQDLSLDTNFQDKGYGFQIRYNF